MSRTPSFLYAVWLQSSAVLAAATTTPCGPMLGGILDPQPALRTSRELDALGAKLGFRPTLIGTVGKLFSGTSELTTAEREALGIYTGVNEFAFDGSGFYNHPLWELLSNEGGADAIRDYQKSLSYRRALTLASALQKLEPYRGKVYRGVSLSPDLLARYRVGAVVTEPGFLSTSKNENLGLTKRPVRFVIQSKRGRSIESFSERAHEDEVLFVPFSRFRVTEVRDGGATTVIEMQEL